MNSPFFNKESLGLYLKELQSFVDFEDKDCFLALTCAFLAHGNQFDKEKKPYILHVIRVASKFDKKEEIIIALLHDVLEDSSITDKDLYEMGFSDDIVQVVKLLTRRKLQKYEDYIISVSKNPVAKRIKIEDIKDNSRLVRLMNLNKITRYRLKRKYEKAIRLLSEN